MLSGIAHDPIHRDIFVPLNLGAKLLVPAKKAFSIKGLLNCTQANSNPSDPSYGPYRCRRCHCRIPVIISCLFRWRRSHQARLPTTCNHWLLTSAESMYLAQQRKKEQSATVRFHLETRTSVIWQERTTQYRLGEVCEISSVL